MKNYVSLNIKSIAFPAKGCGNGGLDRKVVGPLMVSFLKDLPIYIEIYLLRQVEEKYRDIKFLENEG